MLVAGLVMRSLPVLTYDREFKYAPEMYGIRFPSASLRPAAQAGKYVTSNDPTTLVLLDVLDRNLSRDCPFVVDVSGAVYHGALRMVGHGSSTRRGSATPWMCSAVVI